VSATALYILARQVPAAWWRDAVAFVGGAAALWSLAGGALIGLAAAVLLLLNGRIAGVSGIAAGLLAPRRGEVLWRALFVVGLVAGGAIIAAIHPAAFGAGAGSGSGWAASAPVLALAGLLVGFGTRVANGCTSGHGVCGLSRMAPRSIAATVTFLAVGAATAMAIRHLFGGLA
jgi:uncharacterized membrane protein YedE/YeeE